jgi:DnaJ family protein C protein 7
VLSDPHKKQMFDSGQNVDGSSASAGESHFHHGGGFSHADIFAQFAQQQRGGFGGGFGGGGFGGFSFE